MNDNPATPTEDRDVAASGDALPSPRDFPDTDLVIFDGKCRFCRRQVSHLNRIDVARRLTFISLHDPLVAERFPDLTYDALMEQMYVVSHVSEKRYGGAAALRFLSRRLFLMWPLAPFLHIPFSLPLWQWLYSQIAKRRYRLSQKRGEDCDEGGSCSIHYDP